MTGATPEPLTLASDALEVVLLPELGGRIHALRAFGQDLLRTPDSVAVHGEDPFFWGAYPMAPWCNRARTGRRVLAGREIDLRPNFPDGSAIHGLLIGRAWTVAGPGTVRIEIDDAGWPWRFAVSLGVTLSGAVLELRYRLENRDDAPMPAGIGLHPWFAAPLEVRVPAESVYPANTDSAPEPRPVDGRFDLRRLAPPAPELDATWTALSEGAVELRWPAGGVSAHLEITTDASRVVTLASPTAVDAIAVEPQTHGPDPLRRLERGEPDAPVLLPPGDTLRLGLRLEVALARNVR